MNVKTLGLAVAFAGGLAIGALGVQTLSGQEKDVYTPQGADRKTLFSGVLDGVADRQVTIDHYTIPPGWIGGKHFHAGPVYVYVLEGSFTIEEQAKERRTFNAGELYNEPIGTPMQAWNLSASAPLKLVVFQVAPKGKPLMYKID